jgi:hypothetical protein
MVFLKKFIGLSRSDLYFSVLLILSLLKERTPVPYAAFGNSIRNRFNSYGYCAAFSEKL